MSRISLLLSVFLMLLLCRQSQAQEEECDFSVFNPLIVSHALLNAATKKVAPDYPVAAKAVNANGEVEVLIIVNKKGKVVAACVVKGNPLLRYSARKAALQWRFKRNFGFDANQKRRYIQATLLFRFEPR